MALKLSSLATPNQPFKLLYLYMQCNSSPFLHPPTLDLLIQRLFIAAPFALHLIHLTVPGYSSNMWLAQTPSSLLHYPGFSHIFPGVPVRVPHGTCTLRKLKNLCTSYTQVKIKKGSQAKVLVTQAKSTCAQPNYMAPGCGRMVPTLAPITCSNPTTTSQSRHARSLSQSQMRTWRELYQYFDI